MDSHEFESFFQNIKSIVRSRQSDLYFKFNPLELYNLSEYQLLQINKCLNADRFVQACEAGFNLHIDYSNKCILIFDCIVSQLCAIDISKTAITMRLLDDFSINPKNVRYFSDRSFYIFFYNLSEILKDRNKIIPMNDMMYTEIAKQIDDFVLFETIGVISDYIGEICIENYGGHWEKISTESGSENFGIILPDNKKFSPYQTVKNRLFKNSTPVGGIYSILTSFDYAAEIDSFTDLLKNSDS